MANLVKFEKRGSIGIITVDNPPVNALSVGVPQGIIEGVEASITDSGISAIILNGAGPVSYTHLTLPTNREV